MLYPRSWIVLFIFSIVLFAVIAIPAAYQHNTRQRVILVTVSSAVAFLAYMVVLYIFIYRPLCRGMEIHELGYSSRDSAAPGGGLLLWFKEQHKLDVTIKCLQKGVADIEEATALPN
ncbi:hypothetical protein TRVL_03747 [Trypanosoma vivax]|uniref:Uncharacterized protein n=1 Tax=Trypanosoma vivax (strain Y486) TaxID=1055687 RepID=G0U3R2_TRYVY|nr:hypothetical protein TRVL_03747 [Trypanosoma vivax]CCC50921.1 conserved hypothetical protein [Trypanosoma vivax Y486]